jgi:hypothetical protein
MRKTIGLSDTKTIDYPVPKNSSLWGVNYERDKGSKGPVIKI